MSETHAKLIEQLEKYLIESEKFNKKGVKASADRARKALLEISKHATARRKELLEEKKQL